MNTSVVFTSTPVNTSGNVSFETSSVTLTGVSKKCHSSQGFIEAQESSVNIIKRCPTTVGALSTNMSLAGVSLRASSSIGSLAFKGQGDVTFSPKLFNPTTDVLFGTAGAVAFTGEGVAEKVSEGSLSLSVTLAGSSIKSSTSEAVFDIDKGSKKIHSCLAVWDTPSGSGRSYKSHTATGVLTASLYVEGSSARSKSSQGLITASYGYGVSQKGSQCYAEFNLNTTFDGFAKKVHPDVIYRYLSSMPSGKLHTSRGLLLFPMEGLSRNTHKQSLGSFTVTAGEGSSQRSHLAVGSLSATVDIEGLSQRIKYCEGGLVPRVFVARGSKVHSSECSLDASISLYGISQNEKECVSSSLSENILQGFSAKSHTSNGELEFYRPLMYFMQAYSNTLNTYTYWLSESETELPSHPNPMCSQASLEDIVVASAVPSNVIPPLEFLFKDSITNVYRVGFSATSTEVQVSTLGAP